jgi:hypothetical protein
VDRCDGGVECVAVGCNGDGSRRWQGGARLQRRRRYTTGVKVLVKNAAGKVVLDTVAGGAFLLARLPSGTYTVTAERDGNIETSQVQVDEKRASLALFEWNPAVKGSMQRHDPLLCEQGLGRQASCGVAARDHRRTPVT